MPPTPRNTFRIASYDARTGLASFHIPQGSDEANAIVLNEAGAQYIGFVNAWRGAYPATHEDEMRNARAALEVERGQARRAEDTGRTLAASNDRLAAQLAEAHASAAAVRSALAEANAAHAGEVQAHRAAFHALTVAHAAAITSLGEAFHAWAKSTGSPVTVAEEGCLECGGVEVHAPTCSWDYPRTGHVAGCTGRDCLPGCEE